MQMVPTSSGKSQFFFKSLTKESWMSRNVSLDLGDGKRKSLSPENQRSNDIIPMAIGEKPRGVPLGEMPALGGGSTVPVQVKKGAAGTPAVASDLMPVKQSSSGSSGGSNKNNASKDTKPADQIGS